MPTVKRLLIAATLALAAGASAQDSPSPIRITAADTVAAGAASEFGLELVGDGGYRLGGPAPRVWLVPTPGPACEAPSRLSDAIEVGGRYLLTLHDDATISAINPDRSLASSNIAWITRLPAVPANWTLDDTSGELRLTYPDGGRGRIDSTDGRLMPAMGLAPPGAIAIPWDARIATLADGRLTVVRADGSVDWTLALPPLVRTEPAVSALGGRLYALAAGGTSLVPVDLANRRAADPIPLPAAADLLLASGDGRWLFAITRHSGVVTVVDVARGRPVRALQIHGGIARAALSRSYLYLRERDRAYVSMVRLASLEELQEHVVAIPVGRSLSGDAMAAMGDGMAFLHSGERAIYLYMESGMADNHGTMRSPTEMLAPYAVVPVRGGKPIDLAFAERGLRGTGTGKFTGSFRVPHGGRWRLVVRDSSTRRVACHDFTASGVAPAKIAGRATLSRDPTHPRRLRLDGGEASAVPERLLLLAMIPASNWQKTVAARRVGERSFEIEEVLPRARVIVMPLDPNLSSSGPISLGAQP